MTFINLFDFHCLEFKFFLLSSHCWAVFYHYSHFNILDNTNLFGKSFFCSLLCLILCHRFMYHWDRDISGRLQRIYTPTKQGCEVSVHSEQMDPLPEEQ